MQTATVMVAIGGDRGNTVAKSGVTPAEVAILQAVHGDEAVYDIEPTDDIDRGNRAERERLSVIYRTSRVLGTDNFAMAALFPGAAARIYENFDELDLHEDLYKAEKRVKPKAAPKSGRKARKDDEPEDMTDGALG